MKYGKLRIRFLGISFLCGNIAIKLLHFHKEILKTKFAELDLKIIKDHIEMSSI